MVRARGSFFLGYPEIVRIAALGGTVFVLVLVLAMLVAPARADWSVKRQSREPLIDEIARALEARPTERPLATRLARAAPPATLERLLGEFAARAERARNEPAPLLAYAQLLLAAGRAPEAVTAFERAAAPPRPPPRARPQEPPASRCAPRSSRAGRRRSGRRATARRRS